MRLGIDGSSLRVGGGITHLAELLRHAEPAAHGIHQVVLWAPSATLDQVPTPPWLTRVHEPWLDRSLPWRLLWQRAVLERRARRAECDVLFVPGGSYLGSFRPFVTMCRNLLPFDPPERRRYWPSWVFWRLLLLRRSQARSFRRADGVIFLHEHAREQVLARLGPLPGRAAIIPHGVAEAFRREPRPQLPLAEFSATRPFRWLYVSRIDLYKHQWNVIEGMAILRSEGLPVELHLVGDAYPPALRRMEAARRRFDPRGEYVRYHGPVPRSALPAHYHAADGFVFASTCENMPNILLEAMAAGLPIAASSRPPNPSLLGPEAAGFDAQSASCIADALRKLTEESSSRSRAAQSAWERSQAYTWARTAQETLAFLTETL
jgi:glycosyltransferase involved in cell wall biosynthesis